VVDTGQINDILGRIFDHILSKRSAFPEQVILLHLNLNFILLGVLHIYVGHQEVIERDVIVFEVDQFL
jgi:hypothetical protein